MSLYDKASLIMTPSGAKAEKLYSHKPHNGNGDFTHDRNAGTATRVNKDGYIETVAEDVPRLDYPLIDGVVQDCPALLLEPARTQLVEYSEDFSQGAWAKTDVTVTADSIISPDGTQNAFKLTEGTSTSTHRISDSFITSTGVSYTQSIFAKSGNNGRYLRLFRGSGTYNDAVFDLENGLVISNTGSNIISAKIEDYGNGWYRCSSTFTTNFSNINSYYGLHNGSTDSYAGDGTSFIYIYGAQLEQSSYPTSYIPNDGTTATVTRNADVCDSAGTSAEFNDSEGVLYAEIAALDNSTVEQISISDGSTDDRVYFTKTGTANEFRFAVVDGGSTQASITKAVNDNTSMHKIAGKYKANDVAFWINGFEVGTDTSATMPSDLDELAFDSGSGSLDFYGRSKEVAVFKEALTDTELEALTSWDSFTEMATGQEYSIR